MPEDPRLPVPDLELAAEQRHVDRAYARLDAMRRSASAVAEAYSDVRRGGTHQARLERDVAVTHTQRRLAALDIGDMPLVFGRLDLHSGERCYVGRLGVDDEHHTPLVIDWRAPVAAPFYRATGVLPMGVVRRRHFQTRGRVLVGLDDEVFDHAATDAAGLELVGEGALLASLDRERTGRMHDIVATIQAEQDEAIRADLPGVLVVTGGPGTGKTAVALHRAAYLLYTHRQKLGARGVLLVAPNSLFLHYIDEVLPSLGESDVQLATLRGLKPRYRVTGVDPDDVARLKGDARMAQVIAKAIADRERALPRDLALVLDGHRLRVSRRDSAGIVARARRKRGTHNERRPFVVRLLLEHLLEQCRRSLTRGVEEPEEWEGALRTRLRREPLVREALERIWPVLSGAELVHDLFSFEALIRSAADGVLTRDEQRGLFRPRAASVRAVAWTEADLPLVDEADTILGSPESSRPRRRRASRGTDRETEAAARVIAELGLDGSTTAGELVARFGAGSGVEPEVESEPRTFGHVLVDEAQDLSPMQLRVIARRCPSASMTLVGDFGQASRPGALASWDQVLAHLPAGAARTVTLTVNYRTPAEIMAVAHRVLAAAAPGLEPARAVRSTGVPPRFVTSATDELVGACASACREARQRRGTIAVIAPQDRHDELVAAMADLGAVADTPGAIDAPVAVLVSTDVKGLEFDHVVVVEPAELVSPDAVGLRMLYVTLTRATQTLTVVHSQPLPEALEPSREVLSPT